MSLHTRVKALESAPGAKEPPIVVYVGLDTPGETEQEALTRCGIAPDSQRTIIYVKYAAEELPA